MAKNRNRHIESEDSFENNEEIQDEEILVEEILMQVEVSTKKYKIESIRAKYFICSDENGNGVEILKDETNKGYVLGEYLYK